MKDLQNFLANAPFQTFNLKPDENGVVTATIPDLMNFNQVFIVACDTDSVVSRNMAVKDLMNSQETVGIARRDLSYSKKVGNDEIGITESRQTQCLAEGETIHIEDITSSKVQVIDNAEKIY